MFTNTTDYLNNSNIELLPPSTAIISLAFDKWSITREKLCQSAARPVIKLTLLIKLFTENLSKLDPSTLTI